MSADNGAPALPGGIDLSVVAKELSISSVMGASVGVATRRLTSDALYGAGLCFAGLQCLSYLGFITINWTAISKQFAKAVDQNNDGKLDMEDLKVIQKRVAKFLARGVPSASGFGTGFLVGYRYLG